jgi:hypothetical protein
MSGPIWLAVPVIAVCTNLSALQRIARPCHGRSSALSTSSGAHLGARLAGPLPRPAAS